MDGGNPGLIAAEEKTTTMDGANPDLIAAGKRFLENYYRTFDANWADLASLYREESAMIFDGRKLYGKEAILAELTSLQQCRHQNLTIGCQPTFLGSTDLVGMVSGNIWLDGKQDARSFVEPIKIFVKTLKGTDFEIDV